jgi:hypothetical protein
VSYLHESHQLAKNMAKLLATRAPFDPQDMPIVHAGRAALMGLLQEVHRDVTRHSPAPANAPAGQQQAQALARLERDPVGALGDQLHAYPLRQPGGSLPRPSSPVGALWQAVLEHADRARQAWSSADLATKPDRDTAWSAIADVAAMSKTVTVLDARMAVTLQRARTGNNDAEALWAASTSGLRTAAEHVQRTAVAGPLPAMQDPTPAATARPQPVRQEAELESAQRHLEQLVDNARALTPEQLRHIAYLQGRSALDAAHVLDPTAPQLADNLRAQGRHLLNVAAMDPTQQAVAGIPAAADPRPVEQADAVATFLAGWKPGQRGGMGPPRARDSVGYHQRFARRFHRVTRAIAMAGYRQHQQGAWYVPDLNSPHPSWVRTGPNTPLPPFLLALGQAAESAAQVDRAYSNGSGSNLAMEYLPSAREVLGGPAPTPQPARPDRPIATQPGRRTQGL